MCDHDFFAGNTPEEKFDIMIGNPPWVSRKESDTLLAAAWCKAHKRPMPSKELAWAFIWKGLHHVKPDGIIAFLLPAMGLLLNHSKPSVQARNLWLKQIFLKKVINFSDICFLLFDGAKRPTALCLFREAIKEPQNYRFDYWCPKTDPLLQATRMLTLNKGDKVSLKISTVLDDPMAWGRYLWMTNRDMKLLGWLACLSKLGEKLEKFSNYREKSSNQKKWLIGQGFQPLTDPRENPKKSKVVPKLPFLDANNFQEWIIPHNILKEPWRTPLRRLGFEKGFFGPRIVIPKGIIRKSGLLRAAYSEENFTFRHAIQSIISRSEEDAVTPK